jgi:hypothetical protein
VDGFKGFSEYSKRTDLSIDFAGEDIWISTRPCPTRPAVQGLVESLLEKLSQLDPYHSVEEFAEYNNHFTLYTFLLQAYAIGTRAISSPILAPQQIDDDGFVWTDDKDTGSHYNAHLALCPKLLIDQLGFHQKHVNEVREELKWRLGPKADRYAETFNQTCFFLLVRNGRLCPQEVSRGTIEPFLWPLLKYPVNVHRRFVSGELLDAGVSAEFVDWWASHWSVGEEPWLKASTLSPKAYRAGMEEPINELLNDLRFQPKRTRLHISEAGQDD